MLMRALSANRQGHEYIVPRMLPAVANHRWLPALVCVACLLLPTGVMAQGLGLGLNLGGLGGVDVGVGGDDGVDVDIDLGGKGGLGLDLNLGGADGASDIVGAPLGQDDALQAVRSGRALPLEDIMQRAQSRTDGEIIDAQLVSLQDVLLYEIKVLGKSGDVTDLYFFTQTGEYLDLN